MTEGDLLNLTLEVPSSCDFDIWVATSTNLQENQAGRHVPLDSDVANSYSGGVGDDEDLEYDPEDNRHYYIAIHSHSGTGSYSLISNETLESYTPPAMIPSYPLLILTLILVSGIMIGIIRYTKKSRTF